MKVAIDQPENKRLKCMKIKANRLYKEMTRELKGTEETHIRFHSRAKEYAKLLLEIEAEIKAKKQT